MPEPLIPTTAFEQLLYSVVHLEVLGSDASVWCGTGFFYQLKLSSTLSAPFLISNRHVFNDAVQVRISMHVHADGDPSKPKGASRILTINVGTDSVFSHEDPTIDLAAIPFASAIKDLTRDGFPPFYKYLSNENLPTEDQWRDFDALEDVFMIGCPNGLFDTYNNIPIIRKGSTSTPLSVDFQGRREFVCDIACFGGSSGSPCFSHGLIGRFNRSTGSYEIEGHGQLFLGVLYVGPEYQEDFVVEMNKSPVVKIRQPMHIGYFIKSTEVNNLVERAAKLSGLSFS